MPTEKPESTPRKPRADAVRNRERILEVAREAFTRVGAEINLDEVAKAAGVGPGTLYRHFATRDALLEAVYRSEVGKLAAAETKFSEAMAPMEALRAWMLLFVDYIATKQIIAAALDKALGERPAVFKASGEQIKAAIEALVSRAQKSGDLREDVEPLDLLRALVGVSYVAATPDWQQSAKRLVDILLTGSRRMER